MDVNRRLALVAGSIGLAAALALPAPALGQSEGPGFLFRQPTGSFTLRKGLAVPKATGDPFSDLTNELTLRRSSFHAFDVVGDLAFSVAPRLDIVLSAGWAGSRSPSEERRWLDANNLPIQQTTTLQRVPITVGFKYYFRPVGRAVGRFAWVPTSGLVPYVGAGGGLMFSRIHAWGNFVDFTDTIIRTNNYESESWVGTAHILAGVEMPLSARFVAVAEARYAYAKTPLGPDFYGFGNMDLSGFSLTLGVGVRF